MAAQNLGLAEMELNRPAEAAKALAIAVAADPEDYETRFHLGRRALGCRAASAEARAEFSKVAAAPADKVSPLCAAAAAANLNGLAQNRPLTARGAVNFALRSPHRPKHLFARAQGAALDPARDLLLQPAFFGRLVVAQPAHVRAACGEDAELDALLHVEAARVDLEPALVHGAQAGLDVEVRAGRAAW